METPTTKINSGITKSQQVKPFPQSAWRNCSTSSGGRAYPKQACNRYSRKEAPPASRAMSSPRRASMLTKREEVVEAVGVLTAGHSAPPSPVGRRGRRDYFFLSKRTTMHSSMKAARPQPP